MGLLIFQLVHGTVRGYEENLFTASLALMSEPIEILSTTKGDTLSFEVVSCDAGETVFFAEVKAGSFSGRVEVTTFVSGAPTLLFDDIANDWKGWKGEKSWRSIDGSLTLKAMSDSTGHVQLTVAMESFLDHLSVTLHLVAGQLESISRRVREFFA